MGKPHHKSKTKKVTTTDLIATSPSQVAHVLRESGIVRTIGDKAFAEFKEFLGELPIDYQHKRKIKNKLECLERVELSEILTQLWPLTEGNPSKNGFALGGEKILLHLDVVPSILWFFQLVRERLTTTYGAQSQKLFMVGLYEKDNQRLDLYHPGWNPEEMFKDILNQNLSDHGLSFEIRNYKGKILLEIKLPTFGKKDAYLKFSLRGEHFAIPAKCVEKVQFLGNKPEDKLWTVSAAGLRPLRQFPNEGQIAVKVRMENQEFGWILVDDVQGKFFEELEIENQAMVKKLVDDVSINFILRLHTQYFQIAS